MSEKTLDRKAAKQIVIAQRDNGKTNQEIYLQLKEQYSDLKSIANLITGTALKSDIEKYKLYNKILVAILILAAVFQVLFVINYAAAPNMIKMILISVAPILYVWAAFPISRYEGSVYRSCGGLTIATNLSQLGNTQLMNFSDTVTVIIDVILIVLIVFLCFYLDAKLFPNYSPSSLKTDREGDYIL
jgi:hypothetical protein